MDVTEIRPGDRVQRRKGGPSGRVVRVFTTWGTQRRRAYVHWDAQANGRRRIGGGKDTHSYVLVSSLVRVDAENGVSNDLH